METARQVDRCATSVCAYRIERLDLDFPTPDEEREYARAWKENTPEPDFDALMPKQPVEFVGFNRLAKAKN